MKKFTVRMPADMHARLVKSATGDRRSMNDQILKIVEEYLGKEGIEVERKGPYKR